MALRSSGSYDDQDGVADRIEDRHIVGDWPRPIGFFGAIGAAVALDLVSIPIAVLVAAVPFRKLGSAVAGGIHPAGLRPLLAKPPAGAKRSGGREGRAA